MIDLFAGLGGWAEGGLGEGYDVIGFDIERHVHPRFGEIWTAADVWSAAVAAAPKGKG